MESLFSAKKPTITKDEIRKILEDIGFDIEHDSRLEPTLNALHSKQVPDILDQDLFMKHFGPNGLIIEQAITKNVIIPDWESFVQMIREIYEVVHGMNDGKLWDYIPHLAKVNTNSFGVSICTVNGQRCHFGQVDLPFSLQSVANPFTYMLAQMLNGPEVVHSHVGTEPSGGKFNDLIFKPDGKAHNPNVNAGAITVASLINKDENGKLFTSADRFDACISFLGKLCNSKIGYSQQTFLSEQASANRNFALSYTLKDNQALPEDVNTEERLLDAVEFYFQLCSIEACTRKLSVAAATLANGGVCPTTEEAVVDESIVARTLKLMLTCGMYDYSGEFAFSVGLPAKSGVSGIVLVVIPGVMGIALYSPLLDPSGNSVRGIHFCKQLVDRYAFHMYESILHEGRVDPTNPATHRSDPKVRLFFAAGCDNFDAVRQVYMQGVDLNSTDYEGKTALHIAAHRGSLRIVKFLVEHEAAVDIADSFGFLPVDYAKDAQVKSLLVKARASKN